MVDEAGDDAASRPLCGVAVDAGSCRRGRAVALAVRPAVVGAAGAEVDLLLGRRVVVAADVADEDPAGRRVVVGPDGLRSP